MQQIILLFGFGFSFSVFVLSTMPLRKPFERNAYGINIESYKQYKRTNGMDYRQPMNTTALFAEYGHSDAVSKYLPNKEREDNIGKIRMFFAKKQMIRTLENTNIPLYKKMENIEELNNLSPNIFAGGLMKDFEFEF